MRIIWLAVIVLKKEYLFLAKNILLFSQTIFPVIHFFIVASILLSLFLGSTIIHAQNIKFKSISTTQGLSQSNVTSILQDSKGFMWFGTQAGLNKFDGYKFTTYINDLKNNASISSNSIRDILEDKEGNIWIATLDEGLNMYDKKNDKFIRYKHDPNDSRSISNNNIDKLFEDKHGVLWIGTLLGGLNKFDKVSNTFIRFKHDPNNINSIKDNAIYDIFEDGNGNFWIGTEFGGLVLFDREKEIFKHFINDPKDTTSISQNFVRAIFEDSHGNLWIGTFGEGLNKFDRKSGSFTRLKYNANKNSLSNNMIMCINEDIDGQIWIGTENGGLSILNIKDNIFSNYSHDLNTPSSLSNNSIYAIYKGRAGHMWVGTYSGGVDFYDRHAKKFEAYYHKPNNNTSLNYNSILTFAEDKDGKIWIGTDGGGLELFDRKTNSFKHFFPNEFDKNSLSGKYVVSVLIDKTNKIWAATWMDGLTKYDHSNNKFSQYKHSPNDSSSLSYDGLWYIMEDKEGKIWIGTIGGGLNLYNKETDNFTRFINDPQNPRSLIHNNIHYIFEDSKANLWLGTDVAGLELFDRKSNQFFHHLHDPAQPGSLSNNIINSINQDSKKNLWICTNAGLNKYNYEKNNFETFLNKESIKGVLEDNMGNLWVCSNNGLHKFNPETKDVKSYFVSDGLQGNEYNYKAFYKAKNGEMFIGGPNGFNSFFPDSIKDNPVVPPVVLTGFNIFNKPVLVGNKNSPLTYHITETNEITLSYLETVFSFEFAALNYSQPEKNLYSYKLEGFDKEWNNVGHIRTATYTNLDPGTYFFQVKASNNDGVWNEEGATIKLVITPPFWNTWWFKLLLAIIFVGTAVTLFKLRIRGIEEKKAALEVQVQKRTSELKNANDELRNQKEKIFVQKEEIQSQAQLMQIKNQELSEKQDEIFIHTKRVDGLYYELKESIRAAETIQRSILSPEAVIQKYLPESFVLNLPKDVVSGDFYWFNEIEDHIIIAAADCIGHGVSGSFMSINGYHLLKAAINESIGLIASEILDKLNESVMGQIGLSNIDNGMDISLCIINKERNKVQYAGAKNPLYILRQNELIQVKGDIFSIGMTIKKTIRKYNNNEIELHKGDLLYIFSDGYVDQMGGPDGMEKIMAARFRELLISIQNEPLENQKSLMIEYLGKWKNGVEQLDDILVIGFKI
ncbi:MAG: SpoIIE family protein phosphatase [Bacteroidota bacterium]|nr:SpoIIE family protein phosphatase [Bacteroidota bacterium]